MVVLVAGAAGTLAACGSNDSASSASGGASASTTAKSGSSTGIGDAKKLAAEYSAERPDALKSVLTSLPKKPPEGKTLYVLSCTIPTCKRNTDAAADAAKALKWNVREFSTQLTPEAYQQAWAQMLQGKPDYVVYTPITPNAAVSGPLKEAQKRGIKLVEVAPPVPTDQAGQFSVIGTIPHTKMYRQLGKAAAFFVLSDAGKPTSAVATIDPSFPNSQSIPGQSFKDEMLRECPTCKADLLKIGLQNPATANQQTVINYLQRHPDVKYVFLRLSDHATDLPGALKAAGITGVKVVIGTPGEPEMQGIQDGAYAAAIQTENVSAGWRATDLLARDAVGAPLNPGLTNPEGYARILTKANVTSTDVPTTPGTPDAFLDAWHVTP